jgi:arylsulfatase B
VPQQLSHIPVVSHPQFCSYTLPFSHPEILQRLEVSVIEINATAVPPGNLAKDPRADPRFWDHTWTNFGDYSVLNNAVN